MAPTQEVKKRKDTLSEGPEVHNKKARKAKGAAAGRQTPSQDKRRTGDIPPHAQEPKKSQVITQSVVSKWESLRRHDLERNARAELVTAILQEMAGQIPRMARSPTGSRVLQACVKHGAPEQRSSILAALQPDLLDLSKSPYAHFLVCKVIDTAPKGALEGILRAFKGQVVQLLRHPSACSVINELHVAANARQRRALEAEFYGRSFTLFEQNDGPATLRALLVAADATGKKKLLQQLSMNLVPIMEKGLLDPLIVHGAMAEYMECAPASVVAEAVELLAGPALLHCVHSRPGAAVAARVLAQGSAKQRKKAIKAMKGHVKVMAKDEWAHVVLIAALAHTDDTALLAKVILPEVVATLEELVTHKYGHRLLLHLIAPAHLEPHIVALVHPALDSSLTAEGDAEGGSAGPVGATSKKDGMVRRRELLGSGQASLAGKLGEACCGKAAELLVSPEVVNVLLEAASGGEAGLLAKASPEGVQAVQDAIVSAALQDDTGEGPVLESYFGSRALKRLILVGQEQGMQGAEARRAAAKLWTGAMEAQGVELASSHAAKIMAAMYRHADDGTRESVKSVLMKAMAKGEHEVDAWVAKILHT